VFRPREGPCFGVVEGETVALIAGTPFSDFARTGKTVPLAEARLLVPVVPGTFYAIGSNYRDHVEKMAEAAGREPIYYERPRVGYRANSALIAHGEDIVKPADSTDEFQYEAEIVVVISEISKYNTLSPGDVVWLGTDDKPHNMKVGDMLEIEITGIGLLRNQVVAEVPRR
jgi:2-keto-4-pentenoate hydratase/2-oxohepta-3-ene-1,7-dioic acid hydratase in catechol pathway